jgi:hypothetical protein
MGLKTSKEVTDLVGRQAVDRDASDRRPDSPEQVRSLRWAYSFRGLLLLTVVSAVGAMLAGYALYLPTVRQGLDVWLGRSAQSAEVGDSFRQAHLAFLLFCYAAPSALMIAVRVCQVWGRRLADNQRTAALEDEAFRIS